MPKAMDMDALPYAPEYTVASGEFSHITPIDGLPFVTCEEHVIRVVWPYRDPVIELPCRYLVDTNHPTLSSLTVEYSDGTVFRIDVRNPKRKNLRATKLSAKSEEKDALIPQAARALCKRGKKA